MNTSRERISFNGLAVVASIAALIAVLVAVALAFDALWIIVAAVAVLGLIFVLSLAALALIARFASPAVIGIVDARTDLIKERNRHDEVMIKYTDYKQIEAPREQETPKQILPDTRYDLLLNLCLLTIKSAAYGPTSRKLMTADDAQADRSGLFADRMNWDAASKYGQSIGYLYTQRGGNPEEQGLKIDCGDKGNTAADLLVALHNRNTIRDSAINALPGVSR